MFQAAIETLEDDRTARYSVSQGGTDLSYLMVLDLWQNDDQFRDYFTSLLAASSFEAFRWETPALTVETAQQPFEFVLFNAPSFVSRKPDSLTYRDYFSENDEGVVTFPNIRRDATLVVPSPQGPESNYGHLAAFVRGADQTQTRAFWRVLGRIVTSQLGRTPIWISTAGGGVAWLHVRIDPRPKYYWHAPYKAV